MDTKDKVEKFLNKDTSQKDREEFLTKFLNEIQVSDKITRWKEYFGIKNSDRQKFWEILNKISPNVKEDFLSSASTLSNDEKIDLYNKTPKKFQTILSKIIVTKFPAKTASKGLITVIAIYLLISITLILVLLWPTVTLDIPVQENIKIFNMTSGTITQSSGYIVSYDFWPFNESEKKAYDIDTHFVFLVILGGSLGALIHGLAKISQNTQEGIVRQRDVLWYASRPFLGAALSVAVYMIFRGGLLTTTNLEVLSPYGIVGLSIIVGVSTQQVTQKLKDMLNAVFPTKTVGSE